LAGKIMFDVCGKREYQLPAGAEESVHTRVGRVRRVNNHCRNQLHKDLLAVHHKSNSYSTK
jgi:hypothetical protein